MNYLSRLSMIFAGIGICLVANATGDDCCPTFYNDCCYDTSCCDRGWSIEAGYIFWKARRTQFPFSGHIVSNPFGATFNGIPVDSDSYRINIVQTDYDWDHGFRVALGYGCCEDWELLGRYTYFSACGSRSLGNPLVDTDSVFANLIDRSLSDSANLNGDFDGGVVDAASEKIDLCLHVADFDYRKTECYCNLKVTYVGGLRFSYIDQDQSILYSNTEGANTDTYNISIKTNMWGVGPQAGSEIYYPICSDKFSLYGRGTLSLLLGCFDLSRRDEAFNDPNDIEIRCYEHDYYIMVPVLELGVGFNYQWCNWSLRFGYEFLNWFNTYQHIDFPGWDDIDDETAQVRFIDGNLSFDGLFVEIRRCF